MDAWLSSNQKEKRLKRRRWIFPIWLAMEESRTISPHDQEGNLVEMCLMGIDPPIELFFKPIEAITTPELAAAWLRPALYIQPCRS